MGKMVEITMMSKAVVDSDDITFAVMGDPMTDKEQKDLRMNNKVRGMYSLKACNATINLLKSSGAVKIPKKKGYHTNKRSNPMIVVERIAKGIKLTGNDPKQLFSKSYAWEDGTPTYREFTAYMANYKHDSDTSYSRNLYLDPESGLVTTSMEKFYQVFLA